MTTTTTEALIDVRDAASACAFGEQPLQLLAERGHIVGAKLVAGRWRFPRTSVAQLARDGEILHTPPHDVRA